MFEPLQPAQSTRSLRQNLQKTILPRRLPLGSQFGPQQSVSVDKPIASRISGSERMGGATARAGTPHNAGVNTSNQRCAPEHLESALCAPPGPRVARLGSHPFLGPLDSSSSQHRRTLEVVLQKNRASLRITSSRPLQKIAAETG